LQGGKHFQSLVSMPQWQWKPGTEIKEMTGGKNVLELHDPLKVWKEVRVEPLVASDSISWQTGSESVRPLIP
jgi:hypothetical protein